MKGVVLAGGLGTRLSPMTKITNKHLLPVYKKPMIFYPLQMLADAGVEEVIIVTGGNSAGDFLRLIGNGNEFGFRHVHYAYQDGQGGIAQALSLAEPYVDSGDKIIVVLGDNILEHGALSQGIQEYSDFTDDVAMIFLTEVEHPWEYGIVELRDDAVTRIIEKPEDPPTNLAVIGVYMYPHNVFDSIKTLKPSTRGELEITDVNNMYLDKGKLRHRVLDGWWMDAGENPEALLLANIKVARSEGADI